MTPSACASSLWIDQASYFGPNRRWRASGFRIRERRSADLSGPAPSLNVALRKLRCRVIEATPGKNAAVFAECALGAANLAARSNMLEAQMRLEDLARRILLRPERDWRALIYRTLDQVSIEIYRLH